tara:strand:- start:6713 stop:7663 length:951 start_codon:yes stop_codon:yes gene_type:complete
VKILVTGCAGFIGFSLIKKLLNQGHSIVGIDNMNAYYDVDLKEQRLSILLQHSKNKFTFLKQDIVNKIDLNPDFDLVIHLAAQAGVRLKAESEELYFNSNILGFKNICDFCEEHKINIIYASSSSVYGLSEGKNTESQAKNYVNNLYGLTKSFNEEYAEIITKRSPIKMTGLRFFTVYGPFGRPDMAYFTFSDSLLNDKKITIFNKGNIQRDMTYIDDIVSGIMGAIRFISKEQLNPHEIFNLGNNHPIKTIFLLETIENKLGKKAIINFEDNIYEKVSSNADISKAKKYLNYSPSTNIEQGITKFLDWLKKYRAN